MFQFRKASYYFPDFYRLGDWEQDENGEGWTLHLNRHSRSLLGLRLTQSFMQFNDSRIKYRHIAGPSHDLEDLIGAFINVDGVDGREYLLDRISEYWRGTLNPGRKFHEPENQHHLISHLRIWNENSRRFYQ
jgi:hypothetical protein